MQLQDRIKKAEAELRKLKKRQKKEEEKVHLIWGNAIFKALNDGDPEITKLVLELSPQVINNSKGEQRRVVEDIYQQVLHNCVSPDNEKVEIR